jgi:hypothetical protein
MNRTLSLRMLGLIPKPPVFAELAPVAVGTDTALVHKIDHRKMTSAPCSQTAGAPFHRLASEMASEVTIPSSLVNILLDSANDGILDEASGNVGALSSGTFDA